MSFLVRWEAGDQPITLRCDSVAASIYLPSHLRLVGVLGVQDPEHPDLRVHSLDVRCSDIVYMAEAVPAKLPEPEPAKPTETKAKARRKKSAG